MEYIEREAAKNAFPRAEADAFENCRYCTCLDSEQIGEILDNIPAADVVPVRHGRWNESRSVLGTTTGGTTIYYGYECSVCGGLLGRKGDAFCYKCGARMDKDGDGE